MATRVSPVAIDALKDALAAAFWFKDDLQSFLASAVEDRSLLAGIDWKGNYKRVSINQFVDRLATDQARHRDQLISLMVEVARMDDFPRLARVEDRDLKIREAIEAVERLRRYVRPYEDELRERVEAESRIRTARVAAERKRSLSVQLGNLRERFFRLHAMEDPQERGTEFEAFLRDLFKLFDLDPRAAFKIEGEQIDGAFRLDSTHFLVEARWRKKLAERADLDAFDRKVRAKIENTLGVFISIEGFRPTAIKKHSGLGAVMILLDGGDLLAVLEEHIDLVELLRRKHRHAAETGEIYLSVSAVLTG
jgi:hypothetical protein